MKLMKMMKKMINSKILSVTRRSKYILIDLNNNFTILLHLGMTAKLLYLKITKNIKQAFIINCMKIN